MKEGNYRLLRTIDGVTHFARVSIRAEARSGSSGVRVDIALESTDAEQGEASSDFEPGWITAAVAGAESALEQLGRLGIDVHGCRLVLTRVVGSTVDTRDDTIACAAALAAGKALLDDGSSIVATPIFDGARWRASFAPHD